MKISTKFGGPTPASYQVICKGVRKTHQKRKKREISCQSDIPIYSVSACIITQVDQLSKRLISLFYNLDFNTFG